MTDYPIKNATLRHAEVKQDRCPECGGELDTGWECNDCGADCKLDLALRQAGVRP